MLLIIFFIFLSGSGRNIRHLPCVSRRTGETGLCMFAFSCAKANGTHLGTCIDRFYFGSCCKIAGETDVDISEPVNNFIHNTNHLDEHPSSSTVHYEQMAFSTNKPQHLSTTFHTAPNTPVLTQSSPQSSVSSSKLPHTESSHFPSSTYMPVTTMHIIASTTLKPFSSSSKPYTAQPSARPSDKPQIHSSTMPYSRPQGSSASTTSVPPSFVTKPRDPTTSYSETTTVKATTKPPTVHIKPKPQTKPTYKPQVTSVKPSPSVTIVNKPTTSPNTNPNKVGPIGSTNTIQSGTTAKPHHHHKPATNSTKPQKPSKPSKPQSSKPSSGIKKPVNPTSTPFPAGYSSTTTNRPSSSSSYVPIPVTTVSSTPPRPSIVTLSSFKPTQTNVVTSQQTNSESSTKPTHVWTLSSSRPAPMNVSTTVSLEQIEEETNMIGGGTTYGTSTAPSLVTWTTVDEIPVVIPPDRTRPPPLGTTIKAPTSTGKYYLSNISYKDDNNNNSRARLIPEEFSPKPESSIVML